MLYEVITYQVAKVSSHNGEAFDALPIEKARDIFNHLKPDTTVIGIDEAQFFDEEIICIVDQLADQGVRVILAGLDMDFRGEPFGVMPKFVITSYSIHYTKLYDFF